MDARPAGQDRIPKALNRTTKIFDQFDWRPFQKRRAPQYDDNSSWSYRWVRSADPEGHKMPEGSAVKVRLARESRSLP